MCCHCGGTTMPDSPIGMNTNLKALEGPYFVVLPICKACVASGCHIIVRNARQNATAKNQNWMLSMQRKWRVTKMSLIKIH